MFYCNLEHTVKKAVKTRSGKVKKAATAKNRFHYITRTSHFRNYKESAAEQIEFVKSGNMPSFAEGKPAEFWQAADVYERSNGRTCSSLVVAFPKSGAKHRELNWPSSLLPSLPTVTAIPSPAQSTIMLGRLAASSSRTYILCIVRGMWMTSSGHQSSFLSDTTRNSLKKAVPRS